MWTAHLYQTVSGQIGPRLEFESLDWSIELNGTESINVTLKKADLPKISSMEWLSPWWAGVVVLWKGEAIVAGPIIARPYETSTRVSLACGGIRALLSKRIVVNEQSNWSKISSSVVRFEGLGLGTIAKRVVEVAQQKPGGRLPIVYALPDETKATGANHERTYRGFNVSTLDCDAVLTKLSNVINGPDIMFKPRITGNMVEFVMWTGTEKNPRIYQNNTPTWDFTTANSAISDLQVIVTGSYQTHRVFSVGAGMDEGTLITTHFNDNPIQKQYPLLETVVNTSESEDKNTVGQHGMAELTSNRVPLLEIQMTVRGDGIIEFGDFWPGDLVNVVTKNWISIPDGVTPMRLLQVDGGSDNSIRMSLQLDDKLAEPPSNRRDWRTHGLPACKAEDGTNCYWDASIRGNGKGRSFTNINGITHYWDEMSDD